METLTCPICFHEFNTSIQIPLVLHCGHTFCQPCIKSSDRKMGALQCPLCRGLDFREVSIMKKNQIIYQYLTPINKLPTVPCPVHPNFESTFFCVTENSTFCQKCVTSHKYHDIYNIDDEFITQGTDKDLTNKIMKAEENLKNSENERKMVYDYFKELENIKCERLNEINAEFDQVINQVNMKRKEFTGELNGKFNSSTRKIQKFIEECDELIKNNERVVKDLLDTKRKIGKLASSERFKLYQELTFKDLSSESKQAEIEDLKSSLASIDFKVELNTELIYESISNLKPPSGTYEDSVSIEPHIKQSLGHHNSPDQVELIRQLIAEGFDLSTKITSVLESTDRKFFMPIEARPYEDRPQRIGYSTTISAPHMHAYTLKWLEPYLKPGIRVLDVGCGSGYLTLCLAKMINSGQVFGLDHIEELINQAVENINNSDPDLLNSENLTIKMVHGDGRLGLAEYAPFDIVHVGASTAEIPKKLLEQLAPQGVLIAPIGPVSSNQRITIVKKDQNGNLHYESSISVCYAPLTDRDKQCPAYYS